MMLWLGIASFNLVLDEPSCNPKRKFAKPRRRECRVVGNDLVEGKSRIADLAIASSNLALDFLARYLRFRLQVSRPLETSISGIQRVPGHPTTFGDGFTSSRPYYHALLKSGGLVQRGDGLLWGNQINILSIPR